MEESQPKIAFLGVSNFSIQTFLKNKGILFADCKESTLKAIADDGYRKLNAANSAEEQPMYKLLSSDEPYKKLEAALLESKFKDYFFKSEKALNLLILATITHEASYDLQKILIQYTSQLQNNLKDDPIKFQEEKDRMMLENAKEMMVGEEVIQGKITNDTRRKFQLSLLRKDQATIEKYKILFQRRSKGEVKVEFDQFVVDKQFLYSYVKIHKTYKIKPDAVLQYQVNPTRSLIKEGEVDCVVKEFCFRVQLYHRNWDSPKYTKAVGTLSEKDKEPEAKVAKFDYCAPLNLFSDIPDIHNDPIVLCLSSPWSGNQILIFTCIDLGLINDKIIQSDDYIQLNQMARQISEKTKDEPCFDEIWKQKQNFIEPVIYQLNEWRHRQNVLKDLPAIRKLCSIMTYDCIKNPQGYVFGKCFTSEASLIDFFEKWFTSHMKAKENFDVVQTFSSSQLDFKAIISKISDDFDSEDKNQAILYVNKATEFISQFKVVADLQRKFIEKHLAENKEKQGFMIQLQEDCKKWIHPCKAMLEKLIQDDILQRTRAISLLEHVQVADGSGLQSEIDDLCTKFSLEHQVYTSDINCQLCAQPIYCSYPFVLFFCKHSFHSTCFNLRHGASKTCSCKKHSEVVFQNVYKKLIYIREKRNTSVYQVDYKLPVTYEYALEVINAVHKQNKDLINLTSQQSKFPKKLQNFQITTEQNMSQVDYSKSIDRIVPGVLFVSEDGSKSGCNDSNINEAPPNKESPESNEAPINEDLLNNNPSK